MMSETGQAATDKILRLAARHERPIQIVSGAWFALSCAVYAKFVSLPEIPFLTDELALYASAAANALWWGFIQPAAQRRIEQLSKKEPR